LYAANIPSFASPEDAQKDFFEPEYYFIETADGGHCAFVGQPAKSGVGADSRNNGRDDGYWAEHEIVNFLRRF